MHSSSWYLFISCSRMLSFWLDLTCVIYTACVAYSFLYTDHVLGGNVGLVITQVLSLTGTLQWGIRQWTELENQMISVERITDFIKTKSEAVDNVQEVDKTWPSQGRIEFKSVSMKYSKNGPLALNNVNLVIEPSQKVGVVGRTGAGKTSLVHALFQLSKVEGQILIDGVDIGKIDLTALRSKISAIPQDPVLFCGTVRRNIDPFSQYSDDALWKVLEEVELNKMVSSLPQGLDAKISENGSNISLGQRQLICMARAILNENKILILDEATASIDPQTDELIQNTIRRKFLNCTVISIAHRLNTIINMDRILIMDCGVLKEFNSST